MEGRGILFRCASLPLAHIIDCPYLTVYVTLLYPCRYVVRKDRDLNIVYASKQYFANDKSRDSFSTGPVNWVSDLRPDLDSPMYCKVRHGPAMYRCKSFTLTTAGGTCTAEASAVSAAGMSPAAEGAVSARVGSTTAGSVSSSGGVGMVARAEEMPPAAGMAGSEAGTGSCCASVVLDGNDQGLAAGQYAVFYQNGACLGAAKILQA